MSRTKSCGLNDNFVEDDALTVNHTLTALNANFYQVCGRPRIQGKKKYYTIGWRRQSMSCLPNYANATYISEKDVAIKLLKNFGITLGLLTSKPKEALAKGKAFLAKHEEQKLDKISKKQNEMSHKESVRNARHAKTDAKRTNAIEQFNKRKAVLAAKAEAKKLKIAEIKSKPQAIKQAQKAEKVLDKASIELSKIKSGTNANDKVRVAEAQAVIKDAKQEVKENIQSIKRADNMNEAKAEIKEAVSAVKEATNTAQEIVKNVTTIPNSGGDNADLLAILQMMK